MEEQEECHINMLLLGDLKAYGIECFMCAPCQESSEQPGGIVEQLEFNGGAGASARDPSDS